MKANIVRTAIVLFLSVLFVAAPAHLQQTPSGFTSEAQGAPCQIISAGGSESGNCVTNGYLILCNGPGGTALGGVLYACTARSCALPNGGFTVTETCNPIDPGSFIPVFSDF